MTRTRSDLGWQWAVRCADQPEHKLGPMLRAADRSHQFSWPQLTELEHGRLGHIERPPPGPCIWLLCAERRRGSEGWDYLLFGYTDDARGDELEHHPLLTTAMLRAGQGVPLFVAFCPQPGGDRTTGEASVRSLVEECVEDGMVGPRVLFTLARTPIADRGRVLANLPAAVDLDDVRDWDAVDDTFHRVHD